MLTAMFRGINSQMSEGARHGFPVCCRARYAVAMSLPDPMGWLMPSVWPRVRRYFSPRHTMADGMVPCEFHALKLLWDGDRSGWRNELPDGMCCDMRNSVEECGAARVHIEHVEPDGEWLNEHYDVWMLTIPSIDGDVGVSVSACPWCGEVLP